MPSGLPKRCTHGGPFKITGVEAERYRVRGGAVQRVVTRVVGGAPYPLPVQGFEVKSVGREPVPV